MPSIRKVLRYVALFSLAYGVIKVNRVIRTEVWYNGSKVKINKGRRQI